MSERVVAAFDFDGTLSTRDNVLPFVREAVGGRRLALALGVAAPHFAVRRRDAAKAALLRHTLAGLDDAELRALGEHFAGVVVEQHLRPDAVERVEWHRRQGHELVLVSASLTHYLDPIGARLGFDAVLATELAVGPDGRLTGELAGANVRGEEKVRRLEAWLDGEAAFLWAYGDSGGDRELLARCDRPIRVGRAKALR